MINITTPVTVTNNISSLRRIEVVNFVDNWKDATPNAAVAVQFYGGAGMKKYGYPVWLIAMDAAASTIASVNTSSQEFGDMIVLSQVVKAGAYTAITSAFNAGANRTTAQRCVAAEAAVSQYLLGSEFAGT